MKLTHPFIQKIPNVDHLFIADNEHGHIDTVNNYCHKINTLALIHSNTIDPNDFKGWAWELFCEFLTKKNGADNRIGFLEASPATDNGEDDTGVDGFGVGANGNPATYQAKFRSGDYILRANEDHLSNFLTSSWNDYLVNIEDTKNMLIITSGLKVDEYTLEKMLKNKVRVLAREQLRQMLDNRPEWWHQFWDAVKGSVITPEAKPLPPPLRNHQNEAIQAILQDKDGIGKIILPTGTGKTLIQVDIARLEILDLLSKNVTPLIKVNSSRILLCFQLFEEYHQYLSQHGIDVRYANFNSGNPEEKYFAIQMKKFGGIFRTIKSTTSGKQIKELYEQCQKERVPLIVFSTYHSSDRFRGCELIPHLTIHDEAHNLVSEEFSKLIAEETKLPSHKSLFFTATMKVTDSGKDVGMLNEGCYGNLIYTKSAAEMIKLGEMVPPYVHVVKSKGSINLDKLDTDYDTLFNSVAEAFFAHEKKIKEDCCEGYKDQIGAKVLVVCRGQLDLMEMFKTQTFKDFEANHPNVNVFALSSNFGIKMKTGEPELPPVTNTKKYKLLKILKTLGNTDRCIIFHVDMIGEGIDVPGITGVMPFRNCEITKFVQNVGRSSRLHKLDREHFYKGQINPNDRPKWTKPRSWVIIPSFMLNAEGFTDRFRIIVENLRSNFGYVPEQHTLIDNNFGVTPEILPDIDNKTTKNKKHTQCGIEGWTHEFEKTDLGQTLMDMIKNEAVNNAIKSSQVIANQSDKEIIEKLTKGESIDQIMKNLGINTL